MMIKKTLGAAIIIFQLSSSFAACNDKLLDLTSDGLNTKISAGVTITATMIQEKLGFLYTLDGIEGKYKQPEAFNRLYAEIIDMENITPDFLKFSQNCRSLYKSLEPGSKEQVAIYLLLEKVSEKYLQTREILRRHKAFIESTKDEEDFTQSNATYGDADKIFDMFSSHTFVH